MPPKPPPLVPAAAELDLLRSEAEAAGLDAVGFADASPLDRARTEIERRIADGFDAGMSFTFKNPARSTDLTRSIPWARSVVVGARAYGAGARPDGEGPHAEVARFAQGDHYGALRASLASVAHVLRSWGWRTVVLADDNSTVDRELAHRAGLGWFGKSANLLLPRRGSWFVLGCVVTDAPLPPADQPVPDGCGVCRRCLDDCPTGAIVAPGVVDANRCLAWVLQRPGDIPEHLRPAVGTRLYGCDVCQDVCPPNLRWVRPTGSVPVDGPGAAVDVVELLLADDGQLLHDFGRWYLHDRDPRWLRRNALVVLGNSAVTPGTRVRAVLDRYRAGPDPLLRSHAAWAAERLGITSAPTAEAG